MKLPNILSGLLPKKDDQKEYFFSLYLDAEAAAVAVWSLGPDATPVIASFAHAMVAEDSWDARIQVVDRLLSAAEDKVGVLKAITKTVFGIPGIYLTHDGNIHADIRPHLKKLSRVLELEPVGFVPLSQAIAFSMKKEEGVPPSVILVGCSGTTAHMILYRVGQITHEEHFELTDNPVETLEAALKKHQDGEVLPSRIQLFGGNSAVLEEIRGKLLKHPWPTRANFLHFPKIGIISVEPLLTAVSLAGAAELAHDIGESSEEPAVTEESTVVAQPVIGTHAAVDVGDDESVVSAEIHDADEAETEEGSEDGDAVEATADASPVEDGDDDESAEEESVDGTSEPDDSGTIVDDDSPDDEEELEDGIVEPIEEQDARAADVANVELVTPESLGFRKTDVLENVAPAPRTRIHEQEAVKSVVSGKSPLKFGLPAVNFAAIRDRFPTSLRLPKFHSGLIPAVIGVIVLGIIGVLLYMTLPRVTVTVLVSSQSLDESTTLSVDSTATTSDPNKKLVPGKPQEQSVSGEKTIAVTGKKNIGDPAKGTVTLYNKVTSGKSLAKGTVISAGSIAFTLDADVSIASASESIGSITFGKANANVTAKEIGTAGNVSANTEFSVSGVSASQVSGRNDAAFTGGSSKSVTVVSRADQDALVKSLTEELVAKAKQQLSALTGGEHLIDQTVKTDVTEKVFSAELDQEVKELNGKVTVKVTGVSFRDSDVKAALLPLVEAKIPSGYALAAEQTSITTSNVAVKKDGTITLSAKLSAIALPKIDSDTLRSKLAGQSSERALEILKQTPGVSGAEFRFAMSPTKSRLPMNGKNITITVMVQ